MILTRRHAFNALIYLGIIFFMAIQSIQNTLVIHNQSVWSVYNDYKTMLDNRMTVIKTIVDPPFPQSTISLQAIRAASHPRDIIQLNRALTSLIDTTINTLELTDSQTDTLRQWQTTIKEYDLMFQHHARRFNRTLTQFPHRWVSSTYTPISWVSAPSNKKGIIVDR